MMISRHSCVHFTIIKSDYINPFTRCKWLIETSIKLYIFDPQKPEKLRMQQFFECKRGFNAIEVFKIENHECFETPTFSPKKLTQPLEELPHKISHS